MMKNQSITAMAAAAALALAGTASAQIVWNGGSGDWNTAGNWTPNNVPDTNTEVAQLEGASGTIDLSSAVTVNQLKTNANGPYTLTGSTLTLDYPSGTTAFNVIDADVGDTLNVNNALVIDNSGAVTGTTQIFAANGATVNLNGAIENKTDASLTFAGGNGTINVFDLDSTNGGSLRSAPGTNTIINFKGSLTNSRLLAVNGVTHFANASGAVIAASSDLSMTDAGTVQLDAADQIAGQVRFANNGTATLDLNGFDNNGATVGTLRLNLASTLDMDFSDAAAEDFWFADSSALGWNAGATLNLIGFQFGTDSLRFGTDSLGLTGTQLGQITIDSAAGSYTLDSNGYLIPEPSSVALLGAGLLGLVTLRRRVRRLS